MQTAGIFVTLSIALLLTACGGDSPKEQPQEQSKQLPEVRQASEGPSQSSAPDSPLAIGTPIGDLVQPTGKTTTPGPDGVQELQWEDLVPAGYEPETIMNKYADQIDQIREGSPEDDALMEKIMSEFNAAPGNPSLHGKRIRLPGFVSPLDQKEGIVTEFLLVPYFGACIHSPPPPANQTLLVKPVTGKSVRVDDIYQPVWVTGDMKVGQLTTELANAGYLIENAELELYTDEEEGAEAKMSEGEPGAKPAQ